MAGMDLWIAGAGGVGREVLDVALAAGVSIAGFLDDDPKSGQVRGLDVRPLDDAPDGLLYLVAIGDPAARLRVAARLDERNGQATALIHPRAIVGPETTISSGALVMGGTVISSSVQLGDHAQVHYGATVGHDTVLEVGSIVLPGANVAGGVRLGRGVMIGSGAVVLQSLVIGEGAVVGAGAVVTSDVPAGSVVVGSPARPLER